MELPLTNLLVALGIGLLIGAERERSKGSGPERGVAGVRTFAVTALLGAVGLQIGGELLLAVAAGGVVALCAVSMHVRPGQDPGLTTEIALVLTLLLGALALSQAALASGLGVAVAVLLASKSRLHHFVKTAITEQELNDALVLAAAALVVLPLVPDRHMGPLDAINPRLTWTFVVLIMLISAAGHVATRVLGPRLGLAAAGLASGFVSSTATIAAMGERASQHPELRRPAEAAAVFSSVSTVVQLALVLAVTSPAVLLEMAMPLALGGIAAAGYAALVAWAGLRGPKEHAGTMPGRAFSFKMAIVLALTVSALVLLSAVLETWLGKSGVLVAAVLSGFGDAHAAAVSVASITAAGRLSAADAVVPILAAFSANTLGKAVVAAFSGGRGFAFQISPGLALMLAAAWAGAWL